MKVGLLVVVMVFPVSGTFGQQSSVLASAPNTNSSIVSPQNQPGSFVSEHPAITAPEIQLEKKLNTGGPVLHVSKTKRVLQVPRRVLNLINPFAPTEPGAELKRPEGLSSRAWVTTVGWNPGESAFPDARTHESTLTLLTVGR
jgi:hypothetical protein